MGPKPTAILSQTPALLFVAAVSQGGCERQLGFSRLDVLLRVKAGDMLADYLFGGVTLEALRSPIPTRDIPFGSMR